MEKVRAVEIQKEDPIQAFSSQDLFEEVAMRLKHLYRKEHGQEFLYGSFDFVFHAGRFQCVEERPRHKRYDKTKSVSVK